VTAGRHHDPIVASVVSTKGGVGKTAIAANLAYAMSRTTPTLLADFNTYSADVEWALGLRPTHRLHDIVRRLHEEPSADIDGMLTLFDDRLAVLCGPDSYIAADAVTSADVSVIQARLRSLGRPVIIDCGPGMSDHTIDALESASHVVVATTTDVSSVQAARKLLDTITVLRIEPQRVHLVINRAGTGTGLRLGDVENRLGRRAVATIPDNPRVSEAMNSGAPVFDLKPRSRVATEIRALADVILGTSAPAAGNGS
jgi:pilus assembly protein CpaE